MPQQKPLFRQFDRVAEKYDSITFTRGPAKKVAAVARAAPGASVLDVACGTGWVTLPLARAVGPNGRVRAVDIAPQMISVAREKARVAGLNNIEFSVMDGQNPDYESEQFDAITCSLSLFSFADIPQALVNWRMLLKPGGRVVISTWGEGFLQPLQGMLAARMREISGEVGRPPNTATMDSVQKCKGFLVGAGFADIEVETEDMSYVHPDFTSYWREMSSSIGGIVLSGLDNEQAAAVRQRHLEDVSQLGSGGGITIHAPAIFSSARKA